MFLKSESSLKITIQRAQNELSAHQKKCLRIAPHCGMSMAGNLNYS